MADLEGILTELKGLNKPKDIHVGVTPVDNAGDPNQKRVIVSVYNEKISPNTHFYVFDFVDARDSFFVRHETGNIGKKKSVVGDKLIPDWDAYSKLLDNYSRWGKTDVTGGTGISVEELKPRTPLGIYRELSGMECDIRAKNGNRLTDIIRVFDKNYDPSKN